MKKLVVTTIIMLLIIITLQGCVIGAITTSITTSANTIKEGNNVEVKVFFEEKVSVVQFNLDYDTDKFEYVGNSYKIDFTEKYKYFAYISNDGKTADLSEVTFTFKAKKEGISNFSIKNVKVSTETQKKVVPSILVEKVSVEVQKENNIMIDTEESKTNEIVKDNTSNTDNKENIPNIENNINTSNVQEESKIENNNKENSILLNEINNIENTSEENEVLQTNIRIQENSEIKNNMQLYIVLVILIIVIIITIIIIIYNKKNNK